MGEALNSAVTTLFELVGTVLTQITSTPILAICLVGGTVIPLAIRTFKRLK